MSDVLESIDFSRGKSLVQKSHTFLIVKIPVRKSWSAKNSRNMLRFRNKRSYKPDSNYCSGFDGRRSASVLKKYLIIAFWDVHICEARGFWAAV